MSDEAAFLDVLKANPADDTARLVYADWLDEHNEPLKAEYLRLVAHVAKHNEEFLVHPDAVRLRVLSAQIPEAWRSAAGSRFAVILLGYSDQTRLTTVERLSEATGMSLRETWGACESLPHRLFNCLPYERAVSIRDSIVGETQASIVLLPTEQRVPYRVTCELRVSRWVAQSNEPFADPDTAERESRRALRDFLIDALGWNREAAASSAKCNLVVLVKNLLIAEANSRFRELQPQLPFPALNDSWSIELSINHVVTRIDSL